MADEDEAEFFRVLEERGEPRVRAMLESHAWGTREPLARVWLHKKQQERADRALDAAEKLASAAERTATGSQDASVHRSDAVSSALTKAQAEQLRLLRAADDGTLSKIIAQDMTEFSRDILRELYDDGMLTGGKFRPISGPAEYSNLKITLRGREFLAALEQLAVPDHAGQPAANRPDKQKDWVDKPIGRIGIGVTIFVLGAAGLWAIAHWWSFLLGVIG